MAEVRVEREGWMLGRRSALALGAALLCMGCASGAVARPGLVDLQVVDRESGRVLEVWRHDARSFVAGTPGTRYGLRVRNRTGARVMVVISVDAVNIVTGQTADWSQVGYVLEPGASYDLNGWRKSRTEIAAFEFAPLAESYAARTGRPGNVGVIGMAVFQERMVRPAPVAPAIEENRSGKDGGRTEPWADASGAARESAAPAAPARARGKAESNDRAESESAMAGRVRQADKLGTAHGQREWAVSRHTTFERATSRPQSVVTIEYDRLENLVAMGVIPAPYDGGRPSPFPSRRGDSLGYVPDPPPRR